jgi:hypothetical protein
VVSEESKPGWLGTAPTNGTHTITLAANQIVSAQDFVNQYTGDTTNRNPYFTSSGTDHSTGTVEQLYRYDILGNDPDGDPLTFDLPVAPAGMTVHTTLGVLAWQPTADQVGSQPVVLRVQDGKGGVALQSFTIDVVAPNLPPAVTSTPPGPAKAGSRYEYRIRAQDPEGDELGFRLVSGPANLSVDPKTGLVSFQPTAGQVGAIPVTVEVSGGQASRLTYAFTIQVAQDPVNNDPVIRSTARTEAWQGTPYTYPIEASDPDGDPLSYRLVTGPEGRASAH